MLNVAMRCDESRGKRDGVEVERDARLVDFGDGNWRLKEAAGQTRPIKGGVAEALAVALSVFVWLSSGTLQPQQRKSQEREFSPAIWLKLR